MENRIKTIIFDWGRTLHDPESNSLFNGVRELLERLSKDYALALVSLAKSDDPETRRRKIEESGIAKYFKSILVGGEDKNEMYEKVLTILNNEPKDLIVVDDRVFQGIAWGNQKGAMTVWLRNRKFADELPTQETGNPTYTINDIKELVAIIAP